jgi:hypothetical protein
MPSLRPFLLLTALLFAGLQLGAQSWEALRDLGPRDNVKIQTIGGDYHGGFQSASADSITVDTGSGAVSVERARVLRVQVRSTARRARRVAIAAAIGFGLGVAIDQTAGRYVRNEIGETTGERALTYVATPAVFAAIAGLFPAYRTVYRVR